jgi:ankyrin repeat protein
VSAKDQSRTTPLHYVVAGGHKKAAELLIGKGADVNTKDAAGMTPLDFAIIYNHPETADIIRKHGGKTGEELKAEGK